MKIETIVVNVLACKAIKELKDGLDKSNCITILDDTSYHGKKIFLILVHFF